MNQPPRRPRAIVSTTVAVTASNFLPELIRQIEVVFGAKACYLVHVRVFQRGGQLQKRRVGSAIAQDRAVDALGQRQTLQCLLQ